MTAPSGTETVLPPRRWPLGWPRPRGGGWALFLGFAVPGILLLTYVLTRLVIRAGRGTLDQAFSADGSDSVALATMFAVMSLGFGCWKRPYRRDTGLRRPGALRAAAATLRQSRQTVEDAAHQVRSSHDRTVGSWTGAASRSFAAAASTEGARLEAMAALSQSAETLERYAGELEAAQALWNANIDNAVHGYDTSAYEPATQALSAAKARARAANERAAAEIDRISQAAEDGLVGTQNARFVGSQLVGGADSLAVAWNSYLSENSTDKTIATSLASRAKVLTHLGRAGGAIGAGLGQLLKDADNPQMSDAERAGRVVGQGVSVGGAAMVGATLGSVVPGAGTIIGGLGGAVVGLTAGYLAGDAMDSVNDGFVDGMGHAFDDVASW